MDGIVPYRPDAPKKKRKMIQPTKDYLRAELKLAEAEIERLQTEVVRLRRPSLWRQFWGGFLDRPPPNPPGLYQPLPGPDLPCNPPPRRP